MENSLLAFLAGTAGILSPCILPLLPIITASALRDSIGGLFSLSLGLSLSFAITGSVLTFILLQLNISTELFRYISAYTLLFFSLCLLIKPIGDWLSGQLSKLTQFMPQSSKPQLNNQNLVTQFFIGFSLGAIWLPCVGPTLGAAIALASIGEALLESFFIMLCYGLGAGLALSIIGLMSSRLFSKLKGHSNLIRQIVAISFFMVAMLVITGGDKLLQTWAIRYLPGWLYGL